MSIFGARATQALAGETNSDLSFLTNGLSAYYPFNGNAQDASGHNRHATVYRAELTEDRFGRTNNAYTFSGTNYEFILVPEEVGISGASNVTVCLWFNPSSPGLDAVSRMLFTRYNWINSEGVPSPPIVTDLELYHNNILYLFVDGAGEWSLNQSLKMDTWYHIAFSLNGNDPDSTNRMHIYLNGQSQQIGPSECPAQISGSVSKSITAIGALVDQNLNSANHFDGSIDDVRIYTRTLSAEEIASLYAYESAQRPSVTIAVKSVRVTLLVEPGKTYQLKSSSDLQTWVANAPPFIATAPQLDQDFDVTDGQRYFQLMEAP